MPAKISLRDMDDQQLQQFMDSQQELYRELCARKVKLDLTRGKPGGMQLDLSNPLLSLPGAGAFRASDGTDVRNYGGQSGIADIRKTFAELFGLSLENIIAQDNSSLAIMYDLIADAMLFGLPEGDGPWFDQDVKFICPVPGYDRHFAINEHLGIEMIPVELGPDGPDVAQVTELMASDRRIKGMWMMPAYSNPSGVSYSPDNLRAILAAPAAAPDFRIWVDYAYAFHHLTDQEPAPMPVLQWANEVGNPQRVFIFASTSKITFAGAGISFLAASQSNLAWYLEHAGKRSIGPDKVNQLRHAKFLGDAEGVRALMRRHRELLAPKFKIVDETLKRRIGELHVASWTKPKGGYFVSLDVMDGTASRVVELAEAAGIKLTPAGSAFPYGKDPNDREIRIAPSNPSRGELSEAMDGLATCVLIASAEKLLAERD